MLVKLISQRNTYQFSFVSLGTILSLRDTCGLQDSVSDSKEDLTKRILGSERTYPHFHLAFLPGDIGRDGWAEIPTTLCMR